MLQISRRVEYALRATVFLAQLPPGVVISFREVAEREEIPKEFLAKILRSLAEAHIVRAERGTTGGFSLARPADQITFLEVLEATEGPVALNNCCPSGSGCTRLSACALKSVWQRAEAAMLDVLRGSRVSDYVGNREAIPTAAP